MFDRILIDGIVIIYPYELDQNINDIIIKKLASKYIVCNKKYGCVTKINKIHNQYKTYIERNTSNIKVHIKFMVERILPRIDKRLNCKVHMIFNHGIFAQIDQHIKILIPIASIKNGKFIQNSPDGSIFQIELAENGFGKQLTKAIGRATGIPASGVGVSIQAPTAGRRHLVGVARAKLDGRSRAACVGDPAEERWGVLTR